MGSRKLAGKEPGEGEAIEVGGHQKFAVSKKSGQNTFGLSYWSLVLGAATKSPDRRSKKHQWLSLGGNSVEWALEWMGGEEIYSSVDNSWKVS